MRFDQYNFAPVIKKNLENLGFKRPTDIQYKAIPPILNNEDVLAVAHTGTGKTAAFAIPVIERLYNKLTPHRSRGIRCLVMVPTHELAIQVSSVFEKLCIDTNLQVLGLYGGVDQTPQILKLNSAVDILVATPGRLFDLESQGYLSLKDIEILILDEADHMLELGFIHDMRQLITRVPRDRQTLFFSATIDEHIKDLAYSLVRKAVRIHLSAKDPISKNITHSVAYIEMDDKRFFLEHIVKDNPESKILVFVRTKVRAERVAKALERVHISSETIHGDKPQKERNQVMQNFKEGVNKILIATDISARGVDIPNVDYVINYDLPEVAENYVHRVGRTGRGINKGKALSFCSAEEKEILKEIEGFLNNDIKVLTINKTEYEGIVDVSEESEHDWQALINDNNSFLEKKKKKKK